MVQARRAAELVHKASPWG